MYTAFVHSDVIKLKTSISTAGCDSIKCVCLGFDEEVYPLLQQGYGGNHKEISESETETSQLIWGKNQHFPIKSERFLRSHVV